MSKRQRYDLILSVYLTSRGMAWVLFEGAYTPVDWGNIDVRVRKSYQCMKAFVSLIKEYRPDALVLEDTSESGSERVHRIHKLNERMHAHAVDADFPVMQFSRSNIQQAFAKLGAMNKDRIARVIAEHIPCFEQYVPPVRKPWMSEDARMGYFDATALALLFYQNELTRSSH